eukprot:6074214-Pyramimonas_sp.AAC.2
MLTSALKRNVPGPPLDPRSRGGGTCPRLLRPCILGCAPPFPTPSVVVVVVQISRRMARTPRATKQNGGSGIACTRTLQSSRV